MKKNKTKVLTLNVVRFNTLKNASLFDDTFESVSYGDACFTLIGANVLIRELEQMDAPKLAPLIKELREIPQTTKDGAFIYVALDG